MLQNYVQNEGFVVSDLYNYVLRNYRLSLTFAGNLLFAKFLLGFNVIIHCTACCIAYLILHQLWTCFTQSIYSSHFCKWCFHIKSDRDFQNGKVRQEFHIFKLLYNLYLLIVQTWFYYWYYLHTALLFFDTFMFSLVLLFDYVFPLVFIILKLCHLKCCLLLCSVNSFLLF